MKRTESDKSISEDDENQNDIIVVEPTKGKGKIAMQLLIFVLTYLSYS